MTFNNIIVEERDTIWILYINRPDVMNALNENTLLEIKSVMTKFANNSNASVMIITGSGERAFVAGADIAVQYPFNTVESRQWGLLGHEVFRMIENIQKPVLAAINGYALGGGCELAMACDIRLASKNAQFGQPEVNLGITPGFGGTQRLPRLVGKGKAKELIFTGKRITADEAYRIGLVDEIYPSETLLEEAVNMAMQIASKAPLAVQYAKEQINRGLQVDIDSGSTIEIDMFALCFATDDQKEGMGAFLEKRKPVFKGK